MNDRRKHERARPGIRINVFNLDTRQPFGNLVDISTEGIMLIGDKNITATGPVHLRLELPVSINGVTELTFEACNLWSRKDDDSYYYRAGFQLKNVSDDIRKIIEMLINSPEFLNLANYISR
nr:PilZ domain-containing protein [candidate division Zixibacteria bacterium]